MSRIHAILFVVCASLLVLAPGCARPSLVGKWSGNYPILNQNLATVIEFKSDGTLAQTTKSPLGELSGIGTYKVDGDKIAIHLDKVSVGSQPLPIPGKAADQNAAFKIEGDKLTLTNNGRDMEFTRGGEQALSSEGKAAASK